MLLQVQAQERNQAVRGTNQGIRVVRPLETRMVINKQLRIQLETNIF